MGGILRCAQGVVELFEALRCADIHPVPGVMFAADLAQRDLFAQQRGERGLGSARDVSEQRGLIDADAAEGESAASADRVDAAPSLQTEITIGMVRRIVDQHEMCAIAVGLQRCRMLRQVARNRSRSRCRH